MESWLGHGLDTARQKSIEQYGISAAAASQLMDEVHCGDLKHVIAKLEVGRKQRRNLIAVCATEDAQGAERVLPRRQRIGKMLTMTVLHGPHGVESLITPRVTTQEAR